MHKHKMGNRYIEIQKSKGKKQRHEIQIGAVPPDCYTIFIKGMLTVLNTFEILKDSLIP